MTDTATAAPAFDRSVLERKERNELATIARALGMRPGPRAGKALIIDQILRETGIESAPEKPKRGRPRKAQPIEGGEAAGEEASPSNDDGPALSRGPNAAEGDVVSEGGSGSLPPAREGALASGNGSATGNGNGAPGREGGRRPYGARRGGSATLFDPFAEAAAAASAPPARDDVEDLLSDRDEPAGAPRTPANGTSSEVSERRGAGSWRGEGSGRGESGRGESGRGESGRGESGREATPGEGARPESSRADAPRDVRDGRGDAGRRDQREGRSEGRTDGGAPRTDAPNTGGKPAPGGFSRDRNDRQDRPQQNRPFADRTSFEAEDGKSRRRRRRGRERDRVSPERDAAADRLSETYQGELIDIEGLLDIADQGYGYIRASGYLPSPRDVYVPVNKVRQLGLRKGDKVAGAHRPPTPQEKFPAIVRIDTVNGLHPDVARLRPKFEELTPLFPDERLRLEMPGDPGNMVARIVELVSPIGKGQRGLIVSPPKAGKTTIMKQIAHSIEANNPEVHLMVLLVDERPEEVTDMRRSVRGEVVASTFDRPADEHTLVAELAIERAKRLVEEGKHVVIILDGITRLARAYNLAAPATGRIMSGGIDTGALYPPKKFFGAARNVEEGGSLTILATALIETGSTMDTVIFEEFKGTGNMELRLDRRLAEKRIYPAINVNESSTRREELLYDKRSLEAIWKLRRVLNGLAEGGSAAAGLELLMDRIKTTRSNAEFLSEIAKAPSVGG